jgi:putative spermidine/putrescine transport system permease protein
MAVVNLLICLFLVAPIVVVVGASVSAGQYFAFPPQGFSLRWFEAFLADEDFLHALLLSIEIGLIAAVAATVVGVLAAIAFTTFGIKLNAPVRGALLAPLMVPAIVVGIAMLLFYSRLGLAGTFRGVAAAHLVLVLPFVLLVVTAGLESIDRSVEEAARSLGAGPVRAFCEITLPRIAPSIAAGGVFGFLVSFDETVVTLFLAGPGTLTLPVKIFSYVQYNADPMPAAVSTILIAVTVAGVVVVDRLVGVRKVI